MTYTPNISGVVSTKNSTSSLLTSSSTFTGVGENCSKYANITLSITTDVNSAAGGVQIQFSPNDTDWTTIETYTLDNNIPLKPKLISVTNKFFRIVYINGVTGQSTFSLQTILQISKVSNDTVQLVTLPDTYSDAFGRLRVSNPETIVDANLIFGEKNITEFSDSATGAGGSTGTYDVENSFATLAVTADNDKVTVQTRKRGIYQPGKSLLIFITGVLASGTNGSNVRTRIGYYDDDNGLYFQDIGGVTSVVRRTDVGGSGAVNDVIPQTDWNIDKLDGNGKSGIIFDRTKSQIFFIDLEWLGTGRVRFGIVVGGKFTVAHSLDFANTASSPNIPYIGMASLPVRYEIEQTAAGTSGSMIQVCCSVISEGGFQITGRTFSVNSGIVQTPFSAGVPTSLVALRLLSTRLKVQISLSNFSIIIASAGKALYEIYLFKDTTSAAIGIPEDANWLSVNPESAVEYNVTPAVLTLTGGVLLDSGYITSSNNLADFNRTATKTLVTSNVVGQSDIIVLVINSLTLDSYGGGMTWSEFI